MTDGLHTTDPTALDLVEACWRHDLTAYDALWLGDARIGYVSPRAREALHASHVAPVRRTVRGLDLAVRDPGDVDEASAALAGVAERLRDAGIVKRLRGELYPIRAHAAGPDLAAVDRAVSVPLGIQTYGVHLNAFVRDGADVKLWVAIRASTATFPGQLDHLVAGGLTFGLSSREVLEKESEEEAGLTLEQARHARFVGPLAYRLDTADGLVDSVADVYDIELPADLVPRNVDGHVGAFELWPLDQVARALSKYKFNCGLIVIDFLLRQGVELATMARGHQRMRELLARTDPRAMVRIDS